MGQDRAILPAPSPARDRGGSGGLLLPSLIGGQHGVEPYNHFVHAGRQSDLGRLAATGETEIERAQHALALSGGAEYRHIEELTHVLASTGDVALALAITAIIGKWR